MTIRPDDILAVAQSLALLGGEAEHRSAVSRAYYAAFHSVIDAIPQGFEPDLKGASSHEAVVSSMRAFVRERLPGRHEAILIADALPKLKRERKFSDYQLQHTVSQKDASDAIDEANKIIDHCSRLMKKTQIEVVLASN